MPRPTRISLLWAWGLVILLGLTLAVVLWGVRLYRDLREPLGRLDELQTPHLTLASEIFDRRGVKIGEIAAERRYTVRLEQLPRRVYQAFVSAEDQDFFSHKGVSLQAILRAIWANLQVGGVRQGASTITQQVARLYFLSQEKSLDRKIKEAILAIQIERRLKKHQILELYLNTIYLGNRSYGIEAAARNFFRKSAAALTVEEAALLAALPKSPARYSPLRHAQRARARRDYVLERMAEDGHLSRAQAKALSALPLRVAAGPEDHWRRAPYFVAEVRRELGRLLELAAFPQSGLKVYTTLEARLQHTVEVALRGALKELTPKTTKFRTAGSLDRLEGGLVVIDPKTGGVLAMQGGRQFRASQFNRASRTRRPLGHLVTPFLATLALDQGYGPLSSLTPPAPGGHAPPLFSLLRRTDEWDRHAIATRLGRGTVVDFLAKLGLSYGPHPQQKYLDDVGATPMQVASTYASFAARGAKVEPFFIERIEDRHGRVLLDLHGQGERRSHSMVMNEAQAYVVFDLLGQNHQGSPKSPDEAPDGLFALNSDAQDAWYVGLNPEATFAMWIGADLGQLRLAAPESEVRRVMATQSRTVAAAISRLLKSQALPPLPPAGVGYVRVEDPAGWRRSIPMIAARPGVRAL